MILTLLLTKSEKLQSQIYPRSHVINTIQTNTYKNTGPLLILSLSFVWVK